MAAPAFPSSPTGLVVAAWPPELMALRRFFRGTAGKKIGPQVQLATVGVGLVEAAAGTAAAIAQHRPRFVILVGTAGVFAGAAHEGVAVASKLHLGVAEAPGTAQIPGVMPRQAATSTRLTLSLARAIRALPCAVVCPLAITRSARRARELRLATHADLENLEAFSVARAAQRARVPFAVVLGIANTVGPKGQAQWRSDGAAAAARACQVVSNWLSSAAAAAWLAR